MWGLMQSYGVESLDYAPRRVLVWIGLLCVALLGFGMYLQHVQNLEPCPMCIVQRYAFVLIAFCAFAAACVRARALHIVGAAFITLLALIGAGVAARQSWLQWYPPEVVSCGRDLFGMIESFPLKRVMPMIFRGGGDCTQVDWRFLGGSIANWSFVCFCGFAILAAALLGRQMRNARR